MKKIALGLALCLAAACASEKKAAMSDAAAPKAKMECCDKGGACKDGATCDKSKGDCSQCPEAAKKVQG